MKQTLIIKKHEKVNSKSMLFFLSLKESFKVNQSYIVEYKSNIYYVKSYLSGYGYWDLISLYNKIDEYRVDQKYLKPIIKDYKIWFSVFKSKYLFQKKAWYRIDCKKSIFSRISYVNSNNIKF